MMTRTRLFLLLATVALPATAGAARAQAPCPGATDPVCPYVSQSAFGDHDDDLRFPQAVAVDAQGRVLVGDQLGSALRRFDARGRAEQAGWHGRPRDQRVGGVGGLAVGPDGLIYVADSGNSEIDVLRPDGTQVRTIGADQVILGAGGREADNTAGGDVAVDGGEVFVANTVGDAITVFDAQTGARKRTLRTRVGRAALDGPQGIDVRGGRLVVADTLHQRVVELTRTGRFVRATRTRLRAPYDVAIAPDGRVVVADNTSHELVRLDRRLAQPRRFGAGRVTFPRSLTVAGGRTYVTDSAGGRVVVFDARGRVVRTLGRTARRTDALSHPTGLAVAPDGAVVIADTGAERLARWTPEGRALGTWGRRPQLPGSHDPATYEDVYGVAVAADGTIAVTDRARVQLLDARGRFLRQRTDLVPRWSPGIPAFEPTGDVWVPDREFASRVTRLRGPQLLPAGELGGEPFGKRLIDFNRPAAVAYAADGTIYVADPNNARVAIAPAGAGQITRELRSPLLQRPTALALGAAGVYVTDAATERIVLFRPDGSVSAFGEPGRGPGQLSGARGLALTCGGELLASDQFNNRVQRFRMRDEPVRPGCAQRPQPWASAPPQPPVVSASLTGLGGLRGGGAVTWRVRCARACRVDGIRLTLGRFRNVWGAQPALREARTIRRVGLRRRANGADLTFRLSARDAEALRRWRSRGTPHLLRLAVVGHAGVLRSTRETDRRLG